MIFYGEELMNSKLVRIGLEEAELLWKMQVEAFQGLYAKYQDTETSPATEKIDKIIKRQKQTCTYHKYNVIEKVKVGDDRAENKKEEGKSKRIAPIFIMEEYRNKGYAQIAINLVEEIHGKSNWELDTILQEKGNCYFYEKMGYRKTGKTESINDKLTLVFYKKVQRV